MRTHVGIIATLHFATLFARAEQRAAPLPTIRSNSQEVLLEVQARDKRGRPVRSLDRGQFRVTEDGVSVPISGFRLVDRKAGTVTAESNGAVTRAAPFDPVRQVSLITLVFDRLGLDGRRLCRTAALDLLSAASGPNVYFAVFTVDQRLSVLQPFENDLPKLRRAVIQATSGTPSEFANQSDQSLRLRSAWNRVGPPQLEITLVRDGKLVAKRIPAAGQSGRADRIPYVTEFPTALLEPGMYEMRVIARQGAGAAQQSAWFQVTR